MSSHVGGQSVASKLPASALISAFEFWKRVDKSGDCWIWTGQLNSNGYGYVRLDRSVPGRMAHRVAYEFETGQIPEGLVLDHLCNTPACVRPDHLEPVTQRTNVVLRSKTSATAINARKTHCSKGHEFSPENTRITPLGARTCRTCHLEWKRRKKIRDKGRLLVAPKDRTHCVNGHEFTPENTYIRVNGHRTCRACGREATRRHRERKAAR